jgi:cell division transport system permease protein
MATTKSLKRSKPTYIYSIIGVALVLFIMGIMGWIFLNIRQAGNALKEDIVINAYLRTQNKDTIAAIQNYISSKPFVKNVSYIDKEKARAIWNKENKEDWSNILDYNPLPESIDFYVLAEYVNEDSLRKISDDIMGQYGQQITEFTYPTALVSGLGEKAASIGLIFLVISILLCVIVIVSIDNTIRLAMFSNRFLIKTMQMVGATRGFIVRPMNTRAIINGSISALIAIALLFGLIQWSHFEFPLLKQIQNNNLLMLLFVGMILVGIGISLYSTHRSVVKYLKMKLDDLY